MSEFLMQDGENEDVAPEETTEEPLTPEKETELEEDPAGEETAVDGEETTE